MVLNAIKMLKYGAHLPQIIHPQAIFMKMKKDQKIVKTGNELNNSKKEFSIIKIIHMMLLILL